MCKFIGFLQHIWKEKKYCDTFTNITLYQSEINLFLSMFCFSFWFLFMCLISCAFIYFRLSALRIFYLKLCSASKVNINININIKETVAWRHVAINVTMCVSAKVSQQGSTVALQAVLIYSIMIVVVCWSKANTTFKKQDVMFVRPHMQESSSSSSSSSSSVNT